MAKQLTLERCGVALLNHSQGGAVPSPEPRRDSTSATDCASESPSMARGDQSNATSHTQPLRIMHWNAEGVRQKKLELSNFLKVNNIDVCCIQETHLNKNHRFFIRGYELYRQDREDRPKGGVLTLVRNSLSSVETKCSGDSDTEYITVNVILNGKNLTICNIYSPPNKMIQLPVPSTNQTDWIIVGDFNSHSPSWGYKDLNSKGEEVEDWIITNNLILINKSSDPPTFFSRAWQTTSCPDLAIATDSIQKITEREVCSQLGGSDHKPVILTLKKQVSRQSKFPPSWNYKKANWSLYKSLTDKNTSSIQVSKSNADKAASLFTSAVLSAAKEAIPRGRRKDYLPFWNEELELLHKELSDAREKLETEPSPENKEKHDLAKAAFEEKKKSLTQESWQDKTASLNFEKDTKKLWHLVNVLNDENRQQRSTTLVADNECVTGKKAANLLAKTYEAVSRVNIPQERVKEVRQEANLLLEENSNNTHSCMADSLTMNELEEALRKLKKKKSPGSDGITNEMLIHLGYKAKRILLQIFNLSWHSGKFPSMWKEAYICPILKKGKDKSKPESYRPVSLTSCTGKLLERIINKRLLYYLESNDLICPTQTGYRQHRSTEDQLAYFAQDVEDAFQEKKKVLAVFFDLSKAFDTVWKDGLLLKLLRIGVRGKMHKWLKSYLFQRTARVKLDGQLSNLVKMREGVPQGGVISPTLFIVFINDLMKTIPRHVKNTLHADDLAVWCSEQSTATAQLRMQDTIQNVSDWAEKWALQINTTKTVTTLFSLSTTKENIKLYLNDHPVPQADTPTFLGATLDSRLSWKPHIESIEGRAYKKLSLMKKLAGTDWGANSILLKQVYTGSIRPIVEYASTSWMTASKTTKNKLDKVQNAGLRIILGAMKTTPISQMEMTADLEPLEARREYKALLQAEKLKRLPSHPLHEKLEGLTKNRLKRQSLKHIVKDLQREATEILEPGGELLAPDSWTAKRYVPEIRVTVPGLEKKGTQPQSQQKSLTLEMIQESYPNHSWVQVFTDGSAEKAVRNGGSGVFIKFPSKPPTSLCFPVGEKSSNYRAELQALTEAANHLNEQEIKQNNIVFLTDSLSALQSLSSGRTETSLRSLQDNLATLMETNKVVMQWIPAHVGIHGNESADKLAKEGSKQQQPRHPVSFKESKTLLKCKYKQDWRQKNGGYIPDQDQYQKLSRKEQTIIFRLRTGHCSLKKHMKRIGKSETATCQCGSEDQTPYHILQVCAHFEGLRQEVWGTHTPFEEKLWGSADELRKTVRFISASQLRI